MQPHCVRRHLQSPLRQSPDPAISTSMRAATSGSAKGRGSTNFMPCRAACARWRRARHVIEVDRGAAEATWRGRRQPASAACPHGLLPGVERTTIRVEVDFRAPSEEDTPRGFEGASRLVEVLGDAAGALCQMAARIEAARVLSGLQTRSEITPTRTSP